MSDISQMIPPKCGNRFSILALIPVYSRKIPLKPNGSRNNSLMKYSRSPTQSALEEKTLNTNSDTITAWLTEMFKLWKRQQLHRVFVCRASIWTAVFSWNDRRLSQEDVGLLAGFSDPWMMERCRPETIRDFDSQTPLIHAKVIFSDFSLKVDYSPN